MLDLISIASATLRSSSSSVELYQVRVHLRGDPRNSLLRGLIRLREVKHTMRV